MWYTYTSYSWLVGLKWYKQLQLTLFNFFFVYSCREAISECDLRWEMQLGKVCQWSCKMKSQNTEKDEPMCKQWVVGCFALQVYQKSTIYMLVVRPWGNGMSCKVEYHFLIVWQQYFVICSGHTLATFESPQPLVLWDMGLWKFGCQATLKRYVVCRTTEHSLP